MQTCPTCGEENPDRSAFIVILMFGTFLAYGGWALFRKPKDRD